MRMERHPDPEIDRMITEAAKTIVRDMTPLQKGLMLYPSATPRSLEAIQSEVLNDHLKRYSRQDLMDGQFLEVRPGKYTFIMGEKTKRRKDGPSGQDNEVGDE